MASFCTCGNPAETFGGQCDRCASLQMLGLGTGATPAEIEGAYLTLVKVWHPDRFQSDQNLRLAAEEKLKEINAAHDYLVSGPALPEPPRPAPRPPEPPAVPEQQHQTEPILPELEGEETEEIRRILRRQQKSPVPAILIKVGFTLGTVSFLVLLWFTGDSFLSSNSKTSRAWEELKAEVTHDLRTKLPISADKPPEPQSQDSQAQTTPSSAAPAQTAPVPTPPQSKEAVQHVKAPQHANGAQPYLTAGLTPMEVLSLLGKPTTSSGERMLYGGSEIDFRNGQVAGWKIDPKTPLRVKLWPDSPPVPGLTTFGAGSSKSDVITLQGTPTLFSDNEFGYGNSLVFFQNGRVVSWKEDPASVRLRVAH